ncbi:predicted protein [Naegleria gruberi]|uniref:Predicted protein n=1 Tax=Naegleria gruberi TaxID=5762 RepID=D2W2Q4_NAEGR|nr:uncharacterized protein NAEGRDRAFT_54243 [Naegleria gruberi]EFC36659.1 predicted protein [Naegleria gruberi]|eukprot:XP_002669403.1 predicted protein [Naegleria gruberi strain NEG-M]
MHNISSLDNSTSSPLFDLIWQNKNAYYEHLALSNKHQQAKKESTNSSEKESMNEEEIDETLRYIENPYLVVENKPDTHFMLLAKNPETEEGQVMTFYNQIHINPDLNDANKLDEELNGCFEKSAQLKVPIICSVPTNAKNTSQIMDKLINKGFIPSGTGPGMILNYSTFDKQKAKDALKSNSEKLEIGELKQVNWIHRYDDEHPDNIMLRLWCYTLVSSFGFYSKETTANHFYEVFRHARFGPEESLRMFYVLYRETPESKPKMISVATLFVEKEKSVCGLYNVGTVKDPAIRRMGSARLLSYHAVFEIGQEELNLKYCTLQSSKAAFNLYKQLGFEHIGDWNMIVYPDNVHWLLNLLLKLVLLRFAMRLLGVRDLSEGSAWKKLLAFVVLWFSFLVTVIFWVAPQIQ